MLENIDVLIHSCIKIIKQGKVIYFDPFKIDKNYNDADFIFITHDHFDHYSEEDILKVKKDSSIIIIPHDLKEKSISLNFDINNIITMLPNENLKLDIIDIQTIPAYNVNKYFHPKENNWLGYIITINGISYYVAGDTDITEENKQVKSDVAFVPIGGTYTMTALEAAELVNIINPQIVIPIHYNSIVGGKEDCQIFINKVNSNIKTIELIK